MRANPEMLPNSQASSASAPSQRSCFWGKRDILLIIVFVAAILALLHSFGLKSLISSVDRPSQVYEDFQQYYLPAAKVIFHHHEPLGGYFYTPTFAVFLNLLLVRLNAPPMLIWQVFQHFWIVLLALVPGFFLASLSRNKRNLYWYILALLCSFPLFHNLKWGQVSIMIAFLCLASLIAYEKKRPGLAALLLALASLVKYYPGFVILGFVFKKDYRFVALFTAFLLLFGLIIPGFALGFATTLNFYQLSLAEMNHAIDWVAKDINSQYFAHVVLRLSGLNPEFKGFLSLAGLLFCAFVLVKSYFAFSREPEKTGFWQIMPSFFLLLPFILNTSWPHYFVWLPFFGILAIYFSAASRLRFLSVLALVLQSVFFFGLFPGYQEYCFSGALLLANLLILANFLLLPASAFTRSEKSLTKTQSQLNECLSPSL